MPEKSIYGGIAEQTFGQDKHVHLHAVLLLIRLCLNARA
jgi:hypothetical protein